MFFIIVVYHVVKECVSRSFLWNYCKWKRRALGKEDEIDEPGSTHEFNQPTYSIVERPTQNESLLPEGLEENDNTERAMEMCHKKEHNERHSCDELKHELTSLTTPYKLITY